jgi:uncharacterized membrane protein YfcA
MFRNKRWNSGILFCISYIILGFGLHIFKEQNMKPARTITSCVIIVAMLIQIYPSTVFAEEARPTITRHPAQVEMEPAREIPVVKESKVNWWWVALGAAVIGGAAAALGGGGGGGGGNSNTPAQTGGGTANW